jgi:hypothetical protein
MALPILDGNQTATTLSTILTGGQHIPAHTVVSLGSQAITDIANAVSSVQISGTVTANLISDYYDFANDYTLQRSAIHTEINLGEFAPVGFNHSLPISGTVTANIGSVLGFNEIYLSDADNDNRFSSSNPFPVSGTVTANNPSGALTTRFGSVTTANTSQLTSCVTNTSRKFLLVQNIATSTVTIGIGFAPTTTQGIQLTAGAGLTFDAFCPTGGVWWLSSTTGSNFSILEG